MSYFVVFIVNVDVYDRPLSIDCILKDVKAA